VLHGVSFTVCQWIGPCGVRQKACPQCRGQRQHAFPFELVVGRAFLATWFSCIAACGNRCWGPAGPHRCVQMECCWVQGQIIAGLVVIPADRALPGNLASQVVVASSVSGPMLSPPSPVAIIAFAGARALPADRRAP